MIRVYCISWQILSIEIYRYESVNPFSASPVFGQVQKLFLENLLLARFLCLRHISDFFF